jgi:LysM repeat protein
MTTITTTIQSSQLDFNNIKNSLKTYLAQQPEFADYNFEASGLSNILDVLAYNTHINGLIANFALNESFLTTAQLRSSVVSHAESLGYTPRSKRGATAYLNLRISNTNSGRSTVVTLPAYTKFTTSVDGVSYNFQTIYPYIATDDGSGNYVFKTSTGSNLIPVYEGRQTTKTFIVGEVGDNQVYVIPDENLDTSTLDVRVYDTLTGSSYKAYTSLRRAVRIASDSTYYDIHETPNGYWDVHFGDGLTTGLAPVAGNKIVITYLSTTGATANTANRFTPSTTVSMDNANYNLSATVITAASGGADKESIETIRQNAPIAFAAQQRLVTALDYKGVIMANYAAATDVAAWGGEDNVPPKYGKVMVSIRFADGVNDTAQQIVKDSIVNDVTNNLAIVSIDTEFVDPIVTYIGCQTYFNYNPNRTTTPVSVAEAQVLNLIEQYSTNNLERFGGTFRRSNLLAEVDDLSDAILDSRMDITLQRRFTPTLNAATSYSVVFPVALASPNSQTYTVTSNNFIFNSQVCSIKNRLGSNILQVVAPDGTIITDNCGSYNTTTGVVTLTGITMSSVVGYTTNPEIKLSAIPANVATVKPTRNNILEVDLSSSFAIGSLDYENNRVTV